MERHIEIEYTDNGFVVREEFESFNNITSVVEKNRFSYDSLKEKIGQIVCDWITEDEANDEIQYLKDNCVGFRINAEIHPITNTSIKFNEG